ncbi:MAG: flagellar biosynthetic protein FliO [Methylococcales bacterium]|jgi:flagellar protein FliO/FliZ|nr:flagellar biosynthetic protein FliO [Methylococcales bacterium]MBT7444424.1 flagellar biosynthetic protein FliO [Methylococcales bacterium]
MGYTSAVAASSVVDSTLAERPEMSTSMELVKMLLALAVVLGLFFSVVWLIKKVGNIQTQKGNDIQIISATAIGAKDRLVLVQVGSEQFVVGVSNSGIQKIHTLSVPLSSGEGDELTPSSSFFQTLKSIQKPKAST